MKKDILIAIFVGVLIGAVVAIIAVNLPKFTTNIKTQSTVLVPTPSIQETKQNLSNLEVLFTSPKDNSISPEKTVDIVGTTKPKQLVIIETSTDQKIITSDDSGKFSMKLELSEGVNMIYGSVFDENGNFSTKSLTVFYTTEKL